MPTLIQQRLSHLCLAGAAALALALPPAPADADMMSACARPLERYCDHVREGRGRLTACLLGEADQLSPPCLSEVQRVVARLDLHDATSQRIASICKGDIEKVCPSTVKTSGEISACIAGHMDTVSAACREAVRSTAEAYANGE